MEDIVLSHAQFSVPEQLFEVLQRGSEERLSGLILGMLEAEELNEEGDQLTGPLNWVLGEMLDQVFHERLRELLDLEICVRNQFARKLNIEVKHLLPFPGTVKCLLRSSELDHNSLLLLRVLFSLLLVL